jgi:hypothetical protein
MCGFLPNNKTDQSVLLFGLILMLGPCQYFFQKSVEVNGEMNRQNICDLQTRPFNGILPAQSIRQNPKHSIKHIRKNGWISSSSTDLLAFKFNIGGSVNEISCEKGNFICPLLYDAFYDAFNRQRKI